MRGKQIRRFHLTTNYRNSAEIFEFAADVVRRGGARRRPAASRSAAPVRRRSTALVGAGRAAQRPWSDAVTELLAAVDGTVGVITPAARRDDGRRLGSSRSTPRVQVVDGMRAKGMEYDGVVVVGTGRDRGRVARPASGCSTSP